MKVFDQNKKDTEIGSLKAEKKELEKENKNIREIATYAKDLWDWMARTIELYEEYTWISQIDIADALQKKNKKENDKKRKKRK